MDRPLWQILLPILIAGFAVQRAAAALWVVEAEPLLGSALALESAALLALAAGAFLGGGAARVSAGLLAGAFAASALLCIAAEGPGAVLTALARLAFAALAAAGIVHLSRTRPGGGRFGWIIGRASARTGRPALRVLKGGAASHGRVVPRARPGARTLRAAPRGPR